MNQKRTPKNYNGILSPIKEGKKILPSILKDIDHAYGMDSINILRSWKEIIGKDLAPLTEAVSLEKGVLTVKVKSSTLYSLLTQQEKGRILLVLQKRFSKEAVRNIIFRIG
ncbi:MAG: DUF721 domain-containing protein [Chlamydiae bacterium]|nr:DUF721 domain-containing protein [Chlamydiota bacterium]